MKTYKCLYCSFRVTIGGGSKVNPKYRMGEHYELKHKGMLPTHMNGFRWFYYTLTGKERGSCVVCKGETVFNESSMKYSRFCESQTCRRKYRDDFKQRMISKYGKIHLLNDPEKQKEMLAGRKISGRYIWSDRTEFPYTGSYELDFLKFLDNKLKWKSSDIMAPSPHIYTYQYENKDHFYIPDFFIPSLNLELECKDDGSAKQINPSSREKDKIKDQLMKSNYTFINYIKIINKDYTEFLKLIQEEP